MYEERVMLADGRRMELRLVSQEEYSLAVHRGARRLVEYRSEGRGHRRHLRGRELAYEFRSVEQLRYDFERDAEDARD